jgi:hypothetical protein
MQKILLGFSLVAGLLLAACAGGGAGVEVPASVEEAATQAPQPGGAPATTGPGAPESYPAPELPQVVVETPLAYPALPRATMTPDPYAAGAVAPSDTVDMGSITPVPGDAQPAVAPEPGRPMTPEMMALMEAITAELSASEGIDPATVTLVSVEPVTWPDGSLGCPAPDVMYTQALVEGYLIIVESGGETFEYHTSSMTSFVRCENGSPAGSGFVP